MSDEPKRFDSVIEMLTHDCHKYALEVARLKAEFERLQHLANQSEFYRSQLQKDTCRLENIQMQDAFKHYEAENTRLKAEVERLLKAGDAMAETLEGAGFDSAMDFWKAAKDTPPHA